MSAIKFNICNNSLSPAVDEVVEAVKWGIEQLGYSCSSAKAKLEHDSINILFAGMMQDLSVLKELGPNTIVYNLEQLGDHKSMINAATYFGLMRNLPTWEYAKTNISRLPQYGVSELHYVPLGFVPIFERIEPATKDIDVFFYGSKNDRRWAIIDAIKAKGLNVVVNDGPLTPQERDALIARSKVVLNICYFDNTHIFEEVRVSYLLNNKVCVVSEIRPDTIIEDDMRQACAFASKEDLPDLCADLCAHEYKRNKIAKKGYDIFKKRDWLLGLKNAVDHYIANHLTSPYVKKPNQSIPRKLNIGSGRLWKYDFFNIDILPSRGADMLFDMNNPFDYEATHYSWRFGENKIPKGYFEYILSEHVFEHVSNLYQCMTTCLELLCDGGILEIEVPYDLSHGAWQDPTHVRGFNERSWPYYTSRDCWYMGWRESCFDLISQVYILEPLGFELQNKGIGLDEILRTPRTTFGMRVKLKKRKLTPDEIKAHEPYFRTVTVEV